MSESYSYWHRDRAYIEIKQQKRLHGWKSESGSEGIPLLFPEMHGQIPYDHPLKQGNFMSCWSYACQR